MKLETFNFEDLKSKKTKKAKDKIPRPFGACQFLNKSLKGWAALGAAGLLSAVILVSNVAGAVGSPTKVTKTAEAEKAATGVIAGLMPQKAEAAVSTDAVNAEAETEGEDVIVVADLVEKEQQAPEVDKTPDTGGGDASWHFYNQDLQDDGSAKNDYNFGPNPVLSDPGTIENLTRILSTKGLNDTISMKEIAGDVNPDAIDENLRDRIRQDPALGASIMAWVDSLTGMRFMGKFYSEAKEQWDVAMNDAKEEFIADPEKYEKTLGAFFKFWDTADSSEIKQQTGGLTDQMYMSPFTPDEVPDIIVMESADHSGWFYVRHFTIKETIKVDVKLRLDCGYQPTNVATVMKVKAKKNPNKKTTTKVTTPTVTSAPTITSTPVVPTTTVTVPVITGGGTVTTVTVPVPSSPSKPTTPDKPSTPSRPDPTPVIPTPDPKDPDPIPTPPDPDPVKPSPQPSDPDPTPTPPDPTPTPPKDPTNGTSVLPNDDSGPGEDTNNPADPNHSTADQPTNSNHMSPDDYNNAMQENKEANETSREGGDSNEPSTPPPTPTTNVDNNADEGTGHGGIDKPTERSDSSVDHDSPGDHWGGPPD